MYQYDEFDRIMVKERVAQFRDQTKRYLDQRLSEDEFKTLRLQNGLYIQRHAPMLRIAIPYGVLSSSQLNKLADITERYDRGTGHFTTRQNLQLNWVKLPEVPDILEELSKVDMHAIQSSGNCIRNITSDHFAGVAPDETVDPRPYCEIIRQWSTFHPEFAHLPRKFKVAVNASPTSDRAATEVHDIGLHVIEKEGQLGFRVLAGGGLGRTPLVGAWIHEFIPEQQILNYLTAILRVYNLHGRRDNKYKARIKILVKSLGHEAFKKQVDTEWRRIQKGADTLPTKEIERVKSSFKSPSYQHLDPKEPTRALQQHLADDETFKTWFQANCGPHKVTGYRTVTLTLKKQGVAPGDADAASMRKVAQLAAAYSMSEIRVSHEQNLILPHVEDAKLWDLWNAMKDESFATPNLGLLTDIVCCPGGDFCNLARARSLPIADQIQARFAELDHLNDIGPLDLNISGCMNACGHHHVGHIGILGVDKKGEEFYQVTLGGQSSPRATIGQRLGAGFSENDITKAIETIINTYLDHRYTGERFIDTFQRIGLKPFQEDVYEH